MTKVIKVLVPENNRTATDVLTNPPTMFEKEDLVRLLARAIDPDEPSGTAATHLAREIVSLVQDRDAAEAVALREGIRELAEEFPRS